MNDFVENRFMRLEKYINLSVARKIVSINLYKIIQACLKAHEYCDDSTLRGNTSKNNREAAFDNGGLNLIYSTLIERNQSFVVIKQRRSFLKRECVKCHLIK